MRESLDALVLAWIAEGVDTPRDDDRFEELALELFRYQHAHNAPYRRLCEAFGSGPDEVARWRDIPPVPTGAFKEARLATFPPDRTTRVFRTSGSALARRGALYLDTVELYEASLLATFDAFICQGEQVRFFVLAPPSAEAPESSLSYMFDCALTRFGSGRSRFYAHAEGWDPAPLIRDLSRVDEPVAVIGTAFAFAHLLDELGGRALRLPERSRAMETGGFKGRSRELTREQLHNGIERALGIPRQRIVNQYGMCELASQFYEDSLRSGKASATKLVPPWVRTRVVDPATLEDLPAGETGVLVHYDLANTGSVLAVHTADAGRASGAGFEVLGRIAGAEERGCSIAADALLGAV